MNVWKERLKWFTWDKIILIGIIVAFFWVNIIIQSTVNLETKRYCPDKSICDVLGYNITIKKDCEIKALSGDMNYLDCLEENGV